MGSKVINQSPKRRFFGRIILRDMTQLYVINSRGEKELFSFRKVYQSAKRIGASKSLAEEIAKTIQKEIYPGIKTLEIFKKIKQILRRKAPSLAIKFSLKEAMRKLGPTGFPFEKYIGEIFSQQGFQVKLNQHIQGFCLRYEIDFLARKGNLLYIGECKYRNLSERKVNSNIALSNYARFLDLKKGYFLKQKVFKNLKLKTILVTNTKFTTSAIKYSKCVNTCLLGWRYPKPEGLEHFIESQNLYPITILPSLKKDLADILTLEKIILAKDILKINTVKLARKFKVSPNRFNLLIKEAKILLE